MLAQRLFGAIRIQSFRLPYPSTHDSPPNVRIASVGQREGVPNGLAEEGLSVLELRFTLSFEDTTDQLYMFRRRLLVLLNSTSLFTSLFLKVRVCD